MALGGSYEDFHLEMFKDMLEHELQQRGSLLFNTVRKEQVDGLKTYFTKLGKVTSYQKTVRGEMKDPQDAMYERRQVDYEFLESDILVDPQDVMNMVKNPQSDYIQAIRNELGRKMDDRIFQALSGNSTVITNGATALTALPSASKIAVNNHGFDSGTGDVALTPGKLKAAIALLGDAHVDVTRERVYVVGNMNQLMKLTTNSEVTSADFRGKKPLDIPGLVTGIDGYLGLSYISYTGTGTDANSDELVYVYPESAIKLGIRQALTVTADRSIERAGNPLMVSGMLDLGATRMFEEKVIEIACDPTTI